MSHSLLIAFIIFAAVMYFTPGPNNVMLLSSGLTYGFRQTLPHVAGLTFGMALRVRGEGRAGGPGKRVAYSGRCRGIGAAS